MMQLRFLIPTFKEFRYDLSSCVAREKNINDDWIELIYEVDSVNWERLDTVLITHQLSKSSITLELYDTGFHGCEGTVGNTFNKIYGGVLSCYE
jgi:hypothetical protein